MASIHNEKDLAGGYIGLDWLLSWGLCSMLYALISG